MGLINVDYGDTIYKSQQLQELSDEITNEICPKLQGYREELSFSWAGDSNQKFDKKYIKEINELQTTISEIKSIGEKLGTNAKMLRAAEDMAKMLWG